MTNKHTSSVPKRLTNFIVDKENYVKMLFEKNSLKTKEMHCVIELIGTFYLREMDLYNKFMSTVTCKLIPKNSLSSETSCKQGIGSDSSMQSEALDSTPIGGNILLLDWFYFLMIL